MRSLQSELLKHGFRPARRERDRKNIRTRNKREERMTDRDWAELMGVNRPTYGKVKGRVKQR